MEGIANYLQMVSFIVIFISGLFLSVVCNHSISELNGNKLIALMMVMYWQDLCTALTLLQQVFWNTVP